MTRTKSQLTDKVFLSHILKECSKITELLDHITVDEYLKSDVYQDALCRRIEVIGEAAGNLSDDFAKNHPEIPIRDMKGMRNIVAHQYFRVDIEYVWIVATESIPTLLEQVTKILENINEEI